MDRTENITINQTTPVHFNLFNSSHSERLKRVFDFVVSLLLLPIITPFFLLICIMVRINSRGPIIFKSHRVGRYGETFQCLKFRTMYINAESKLNELIDNNSSLREEWEKDHKLKNDPRVTKVGKILRKLSLDELPQIINVLKGEMSLVGPRPIVAAEINKYGNNFGYYKSVRPGITGLWQTNGRNDVSYDQRVAFDKLYSLENNLIMDIKIIFKTVPVALSKRGAY